MEERRAAHTSHPGETMTNVLNRVPRGVIVTAVFCAAAAGLAGAAAAFSGGESPASRPAGQVVRDQPVRQAETATVETSSATTTTSETAATQAPGAAQIQGGQPAGQPVAPAAEPEPTTTTTATATTTQEPPRPEQPPSQVPTAPPAMCTDPVTGQQEPCEDWHPGQ
ncbi:hypothetical protein SUDANB95_05527 [Actinosynnema sp. ALI-1.44]